MEPALELASCVICADEFRDAGDRTARSLRCGHTLCTGCLSLLLRGEISGARACPSCREPLPPGENAGAFARNYAIEAVAGVLRKTRSYIEGGGVTAAAAGPGAQRAAAAASAGLSNATTALLVTDLLNQVTRLSARVERLDAAAAAHAPALAWAAGKRADEERAEAARVEAARVEAARVEAARVEAARVEAARVEAVRVEAARVEAARVEAVRVEAARVEAARVEAVRVAEAQRLAQLQQQLQQQQADRDAQRRRSQCSDGNIMTEVRSLLSREGHCYWSMPDLISRLKSRGIWPPFSCHHTSHTYYLLNNIILQRRNDSDGIKAWSAGGESYVSKGSPPLDHYLDQDSFHYY